MSRKGGKKGKPAQTRQQQQQEAAARRQSLSRTGGVSRTDAAQPGTTGTASVPASAAASASAPPARVRRYLDVSAVRIQDWLARSPDLKFRRGASVMLSEATGGSAWLPGQIPSGMQWNDQAGDLDGVVSLVVDDTTSETDAAACVSAAATQVAAVLRQALPHCPVQAVAGKGESYAEAYREIDRARRDGDFLVDSPPAPPEVILAKPCDVCRAAPAQHSNVKIIETEEGEDLCGECKARFKAAGGTQGDKEGRSPRPERRMKAALAAAGMVVKGFHDDFAQLAEAGRRDSDDAATQIALIYADGNRVGAFLDEAATYARTHGTLAKADIVRALDTATLAALADATEGCFAGAERPAVLAHLAGGDDLMVSVPAGDAWPFVRFLLTAFGARAASAADWPKLIRERLPSLSAGLVFHHQSAPFPDVVRLAKQELDQAKQASQGEGPSVAFLDLTADGGHAPPWRQPLTLTDLDRSAPGLGRIARIPRSHRETLVALHRLCVEYEQAGGELGRAETPPEALARRAADLGHKALWDVVVGPGTSPQDVRSQLVSSPDKRTQLRRVLDLARWWPPSAELGAEAGPAGGGNAREVVSA